MPEASAELPSTDATADTSAVRAIAERLERVEERIESACRRAGRSREELTLVAVSKTFPLEVVRAGYAAGLRRFGENRARELRDKAEGLPGRHLGGDVHWHMIGHLQRNKAKYVARNADYFQALDSPRLAEELDKRAAKNERRMPCLVQVNVAGEEQKYGCPPEETHAFLDRLAGCEHLRIEGLMAMAGFSEAEEVVRRQFRQAHDLFDTYDASRHPHAAMKHLSMGMSGDFEIAVEEGATMLRLGSALFGPRDG